MSARTYLPLYTASGDAAVDKLAFFHILERLKVDHLLFLLSPYSCSEQTQKRTGWVDNNVFPSFKGFRSHIDGYHVSVDSRCREVRQYLGSHRYNPDKLAQHLRPHVSYGYPGLVLI